MRTWRRVCSVVALFLGVTLLAQAQIPKPVFEVASVKRRGNQPPTGPAPASPDTFRRTGDTVLALIQFAYNVSAAQVSGGPDWIRQDRFEVNAKAGTAATPDQMRLMVQSLLEDRFKLVVRREQREMERQVLLVAREDGRLGPKLTKCSDPANLPPPRPLALPPDGLPFTGRCREVSTIAASAAAILRTVVIDRTELTGLWSYEMVYAQVQPLAAGRLRDLADQAATPSFTTALNQELGLKLNSERGPVDVVAIESVQPPAEN